MKSAKITLRPVWFAAPALLTLVYVATAVEYPLDFWHQVNNGRVIWQSHSLPQHDTFTHTIDGRPIVNQAWLAQLAMYGLYAAGGYRLVQFAAAVCYAAALAVVTALAWRRCGNVRVAAGLTTAALVLSFSNLGVRPQALSTLLFAVELYVLWQWPGRWQTVAVVVPVELLWANTHGAFPLGVALPGIFLLAAAWRRGRRSGYRAITTDAPARCYAACVLASAAAAFVNPHPDRTLDYVFGVVSKSAQRQLGEWLPTSAGSYTGTAFFVSLVVVLVVLGLSRRRLEPEELLLLAGFALLGSRAERMAIWWALVMAPAMARQVAGLLKPIARHARAPEEPSWTGAVALILLVGMVLASTPWTRAYNPLLPAAKRRAHADDEPAEVVRFLAEHGYRGRAFNPLEWGAYLTWFLDPEVKVFVDARVDFFPDDVWSDYVRVGGAEPGWEDVLSQRDVNLVIWNRRLSDRLPAALARSGRWKNVYRDRLATVYVRADRPGAVGQPVAARHSVWGQTLNSE